MWIYRKMNKKFVIITLILALRMGMEVYMNESFAF